ncbi:MAG: phosphopantothenoylcysteine decarboxylase [Candidatus Omnitrophota bacterium]
MSQFLRNKKILITAGPTWINVDKVRVLTSIFSGTLGCVIAHEAKKEGAEVTLLLGPGQRHLKRDYLTGIQVNYFKYFNDLFDLVKKEVSTKEYDCIIHSASVSDYQSTKPVQGKIKSNQRIVTLKLKPTPKIVKLMKKYDPKIFLVQFKLEIGISEKELIKRAYKSLLKNNSDIVVANDLNNIKLTRHKALIIDKEKNITKVKTKKELAHKLLEMVK